VFLGALLEGILVINFYVPGSTIVILGAVASRGGALSIGLVILVATVGFILAYSVCYILGWFGWYSAFSRLGVERALNRTRERMMAVGPRLIPVANIHPNLGALAATSAGALRIPFVRFILISGTSALLWDIFWGLLAFWLGREAVKLFNGWLLFPVLLVLVLWFLISSRLQKRSPRAPLDGS
jgi:membrane protein DedA with SNARE-associated domain